MTLTVLMRLNLSLFTSLLITISLSFNWSDGYPQKHSYLITHEVMFEQNLMYLLF